ncbi:MAG: hypothetical protein JWR47_3317, partial [Phenylobacterium sp.]|nr:hypothetical protein [Phenylobacterium sp.]
LNVYSSYDDKLPGSYALYVDSELFSQTVRPTGYNCAAHTFPLDMRDTFKQSVVKTIQQLVEEVEVVQTPLSGEALARSGKRGQIIVRADGLTARVQFIPGFWRASSEGNVELTANMSVDGANGRILGTTAEGAGTAQGEAGLMCGGGANAVATAAEKATKQLLGQLGERLSNSPRMRAATNDIPPPAKPRPAVARATGTAPVLASQSPAPAIARKRPCAVRSLTDPNAISC